MKLHTFLTTAAIAAVMLGGSAFAKPPGETRDDDVGHQLWKFNVIALPDQSGWEPHGNACQGARIFFNETSKVLGTITWYLDPAASKDFQITDCDGTDGAASVRIDEDEPVGDAIVVVRVLGPATSTLSLVCDVIQNPNVAVDEDLCIIDGPSGFNLSKSKNFTKIMQNIAEGEFEEVLWTLNGDWKIFDVRVFEYCSGGC